jgi:hypothetical protein
MSHVVARAFVTAGATNLCAEAAEIRGEFGAGRHEPRRDPADDGALPIKADAAGKHFDIVLLEAGGGAVLALGGTFVASVNTTPILVMHGSASASLVPAGAIHAR